MKSGLASVIPASKYKVKAKNFVIPILVSCFYGIEAATRGILWKKGVFENFTKFTGKHLYQSLNFNKKDTLAQVFSCEFCEAFKDSFFTEHLWTAASDGS